MTTQQLHLFNALYLVIFIVVALITRTPARRIAGASIGGVAAGVVALGMVVIGEWAGWWHMAISWEPYPLAIMLIGLPLIGFIFLLTWRITRRFGRRGLAVALAVAAVIGPPRDYWYMRHFPEWGSYGPGLVPVFAIAAIYVAVVIVGHAVMWLIAGPARADRLAPRRWAA